MISTRPRRRVEDIISERLERKWGRPLYPLPPPGEEASELHHLIEQFVTTPLPYDDDDDDDDDQVVEEVWQPILERCLSHPHEAAQLDRRGGSCLHTVCSKHPPISVVRAILSACGRMTKVVWERDKSGRTPLIIAISCHANLELIQTLLDSNLRAASVPDHWGRLPLHWASSSYTNHKDQMALVELLLCVFPEAAGRESDHGKTPLLCAIQCGARTSVVQLLVQACPDAVSKADGSGLNPLFWAIRRQSPVDIIQSLVEADPSCTLSRDRGLGLPLRRAMENRSPLNVLECLCTSKLTVLDVDRVGHTALHADLECGSAREETVRLLTFMAPEVSLVENTCGETPLSLACQRFLGMRENRPSQSSLEVREKMWNMVTILMRAGYYGTSIIILEEEEEATTLTTTTPALHAAIALSLPYEIILTTFNYYWEQASIQDTNGNYALSLAIQSPSSSPHTNKRDILLRLLALFPKAAQRTDRNGRTALALAAEGGVDVDILHQLWGACPDAGKQLDPVHCLYPFQVAAMTIKEAIDDNNSAADPTTTRAFPDPQTKNLESHLNQLSAIFELLLAEPSLLSSGHQQT